MRDSDKKQHLSEQSPGRILRNEVRENTSRRWGGVSDGCGTQIKNSICPNRAPEGFYGTK